ncbi:MAG: OmpH family outer membrane protein [Bacteroidales bacterium]|nr:OmpH family outer membrane protein [Bacteroidales bacterium]
MKKALIVLFVALTAMAGTSYAQKNSVKLGHISSSALMEIMPGRDSAVATLQAELQNAENQLKSMQEELEKKYNEYQEKQAQYSDLIKQTKQKELQDMGARIQQFQSDAQTNLQTREQQVMQPLIDRAKKAIEEVAKENGYTYIFDSGVGALLYQQDSDDIMPLVKKKLGI